ncbi:DUF58 domain-containing protein [Thioflexithrix psekupsensis]|uniref:Uncharacterized protein n=1 Tax=Thioflexithrix psekupsensis TaxID=1570016 RepID=A0A251XB33_9GAMM|nr:DUF58 domain-containing protein [Thioflexithrix psekupsensis]OUD15006.1 hypothetical protein TPSD3_04710 [Thioflexithrix psekupsensis]
MTHTLMTSLRQLFHWPPYRQSPQAVVELRRRQVYIFPTKQGFAFIFVLFILLIGSMNYNNNMGYLLTFTLGSMMLVSILHTHRMLHGLRIEAGQTHSVFAGERVLFQLGLDNRHHAARFDLHFKVQTPLNTWDEVVVVNVPDNQKINVNLPIASYRRGRLALPRLRISSVFPLGLFEVWSYIFIESEAIVYPNPVGQRVFPVRQEARQSTQGQHPSLQGEDFVGYRNYKTGDSPRHIDWKAAARGQEGLIKQFGGHSTDSFTFSWADVQHLENIDRAVSQLSLWINMAEKQQLPYGLQLPHLDLKQGYGDSHYNRCLTALALYQG